MKGYYFIENTVDEYSSREQGSLKRLTKQLKHLLNVMTDAGTGTIYFQEFGLCKPAKKVYKA